MAKQDDYVRYTIRVPASLYENLKQAAGEKSVNAEIVERLDASEEIAASLQYVEERLDATESKLRYTERQLRNRSMDDLVRNLTNALPSRLLGRMQLAAGSKGRDIEQEVLAALEAAYPPPQPFSLDWFYDAWVFRIILSQGEERKELLEQANEVLQQYGGLFFVWETPSDQSDLPSEIVVSPNPSVVGIPE